MKAILALTAVLTPALCIAQYASNPAGAAMQQFRSYKPTIEKKEQAAVDEPIAVTGDLNGDGREDCLIYFVLTPQGGGNAVIGRQTAVYLNTAKGMKAVGAFPELDICYGISRIDRGGVIYLDSYECAPPYNTRIGSRKYRWTGKKLVAVR